ncbi:hypothetical protein DFH29DRAFT_168393 [Suillus ampliporus]|nr:hypothetical protein DFH29DRAFT_168393 [Suillus ampliporus]
MMINRFQNSNLTAGLVLATTTLFLSLNAPSINLMTYETPVSFIFAMVAFNAALFSVIYGAAVIAVCETSTTHKDMETLREMSRHHIICLLLWLACPSICCVMGELINEYKVSDRGYILRVCDCNLQVISECSADGLLVHSPYS